MNEGPWIETFSGREFYIRNPEFHLEDIAHGLSNLCRFNGQSAKFYSVAEHSSSVAELILDLGGSEKDAFEGLMHDAVEAYLSDIPSPFKELLPDWKELEDHCESVLRKDFGLPPEKSDLCHEADTILLFCEARCLLPYKGKNFEKYKEYKSRVDKCGKAYAPMCLPPSLAKTSFLSTFRRLEGSFECLD